MPFSHERDQKKEKEVESVTEADKVSALIRERTAYRDIGSEWKPRIAAAAQNCVVEAAAHISPDNASAWVDLIEITVRHNLCRRGIIRFEEIPTVEELDHLFDRLILSGVPEEVVTVALKAVPAGLFPNEDKGSPKSGRQQPMERKG